MVPIVDWRFWIFDLGGGWGTGCSRKGAEVLFQDAADRGRLDRQDGEDGGLVNHTCSPIVSDRGGGSRSLLWARCSGAASPLRNTVPATRGAGAPAAGSPGDRGASGNDATVRRFHTSQLEGFGQLGGRWVTVDRLEAMALEGSQRATGSSMGWFIFIIATLS